MSQLQRDILSGTYDAILSEIITAAAARRKLIIKTTAAITLLEIQVGEKVKVINIRPSYMIGKIGTVIEKRRTKFVLDFSDSPLAELGRFGSKVTVPANCVERISSCS